MSGRTWSSWFFVSRTVSVFTFKSTSVKFDGPGRADVLGDLTLHGVTKPVVLEVKFRAAGPNAMSKHYTVGFDAMMSIKRSDFGVAKIVPVVADHVDITISAPFEKEG